LGDFLIDQFDGDFRAQRQVLRTPNAPHSAFSKEGDQAIAIGDDLAAENFGGAHSDQGTTDGRSAEGKKSGALARATGQQAGPSEILVG
jgi:hypothetical protein